MQTKEMVEKGKRHLLISVPASRVAEVEAALTFLEAKRQQRGSQVVTMPGVKLGAEALDA